jgi:hypothetical protein
MTPRRPTTSTVIGALLVATAGMATTSVAILVVAGASSAPPAHLPQAPPHRSKPMTVPMPTVVLIPPAAEPGEPRPRPEGPTGVASSGGCVPTASTEAAGAPPDTTSRSASSPGDTQADGKGCRIRQSGHKDDA